MQDQQFLQAKALQDIGQRDQALSLYSRILEDNPGHVDALMNFGAINFEKNQYGIARECFSLVLQLDPARADAYYNRGCSHHSEGNQAAAEQDYRQCLIYNPEHHTCIENLLALLLEKRGIEEEVIALLDQRLALGESPILYRTKGLTQLKLGLADAAIESFQKVLRLSPLDPTASYHVNAGISGDAASHRARWSVPEFANNNAMRAVPLPAAQRNQIPESKIFIATEQGLGDEIMFASRYSDLPARSVTLEADPRLVGLIERSFPDFHVVPTCRDITRLAQIDWQGLDGHLRAAEFSEAQEMPEEAAWLHADAKHRLKWQRWLAAKPGLKIGITWRGGANSGEQDKHSIDLAELAPLFTHDATFISIQYDLAETDLVNFPGLIPPDLDCREDIDELAALISELDLVICIDNATCYLAAAVGTPTWVALPLAKDWRWHHAANWQSNIRQFQNDSIENWQVVIKGLSRALSEYKKPARRLCLPEVDRKTVSPPSYVRETQLLLLNDSLNWHHFGYSFTGVWLYQQIFDKARVTRIPTSAIASLAGSSPPIDHWQNPSCWQKFKDDNPQIVDSIRQVDKLLVNGEAITDGMLLLYLAFCAAKFESKEVAWVNHALLTEIPVQQTTAWLGPVYEKFACVISSTDVADESVNLLGTNACRGALPLLPQFDHDHSGRPPPTSLIMTSTNQTTTEYIEELQNTIADYRDLKPILLTGGRSAISPEDTAVAQSLAPEVEVRWARNEIDWYYYLASAAHVVSGQPHAANIALQTGRGLTVPNSTPTASRLQICAKNAALVSDAANHLHNWLIE